MSSTRRIGAVWLPRLGLLALWVVFASSALAKLEVEIEVGYDETYKAGGWTPFRVLTSNAPDPAHPEVELEDFNGEVRVTVVGLEGQTIQFIRPVELPRHSKKLVELSVMIPGRSNPVTVDLIDYKRGIVAQRTFQPGAYGMALKDLRAAWLEVPTVLVLVEPNENPSFPTWISRSINIQRISRTELPADFKAYDGVRLVVVRQRLTGRASDEQLLALDSWIEFGGTLLVITPRAQAEMKQDPWLERILPAKIETSLEKNLADLEPGSADEMTLMTEWAEIDPEARSLWDSPLGPLVLERRRGAGRVVALALDPSSFSNAALQSAAGNRMQRLFEGLLLAPHREDVRARHYWSTTNVDPGMEEVLLLPNIWVVTALLIAFVVIVGPLNFYLLRRRRRLEMAWVTIPGLSIGFFLAVYGYGMAAKGGDQHYASAEILHLASGQSEGLLLWNSIQFSPRRRVYHFTPPPGGTVVPLLRYYDNPMDFTRFQRVMGGVRFRATSGVVGPDSSRPGLAVLTRERGYELHYPAEQWKMNFFQGEQQLKIQGDITGRLVIGADPLDPDGALFMTLNLENNTEARLGDAVVYFAERSFPIGEIAPGDRLELPLGGKRASKSASEAPPFAPGEDAFHDSVNRMVREGAIEGFPVFSQQSPQRRCRLVARQDRWTSGLLIEPEPDFSKTCALVEVDLPIEIRGVVRLSNKDYLRGAIYDYDRDGTTFAYDSGDLCSLNDSWVEYIVSPPRLSRPVQFAGGRLVVNHTPHTDQLEVHVFNYATGLWDHNEQLMKGPDPNFRRSRNQIDIQQINPDWINPVGRIMRIRLVSDPVQIGRSAGRRGFGVTLHDVTVWMSLRAAPEPAPAVASTAPGEL